MKTNKPRQIRNLFSFRIEEPKQPHWGTIIDTNFAAVMTTVVWISSHSPAQSHSLDSVGGQIDVPNQKAGCQTKPTKKETKGVTWCTARTTIKAPPEVVWKAVHDERQNDPDIAYSKVLEQGENQYKLEQKFCLIPVLGTSTCVTHHVEVPNERIDYKLIHSDHFKAMEGSWVLSSLDGGKSTQLEFSSHLDLGLPVPRMLMDSITSKKMEKRLAGIKKMAEERHSALAAKASHPVE